jgi:hypothetical protein
MALLQPGLDGQGFGFLISEKAIAPGSKGFFRDFADKHPGWGALGKKVPLEVALQLNAGFLPVGCGEGEAMGEGLSAYLQSERDVVEAPRACVLGGLQEP